MAPAVVAHTTPPLAPLPASDAESLQLLGTLKLAGVDAGLMTAEWSANGKPFVTFDGIGVSKRDFPSLPGYADPDSALSAEQKADSVEWQTYIDGRVADLVNHTMYSLPGNYPILARAQLAACPFPMNHYVPQRIKGIHKARLESVGLWGVGGLNDGEAADEDRKRLEDTVVVGPGGTQAPRAWSGWRSGKETADRQRKFGEEALRQRARDTFDPLVRKIGQNRYFYTKPTSLDVALWSQLSLVLSVEWPNAVLGDLLRSTYPTLVAHHDRVQKKLGAWPERLATPAPPSVVSSLREYLPSWLGGPASEAKRDADAQRQAEKDKKFRYGRYAWFAGAGIAFITYILASGIVQIDFGDEEEWVDVEEEDDDEEEDNQPQPLTLPPRTFSGLPVYDDDEDAGEQVAEAVQEAELEADAAV